MAYFATSVDAKNKKINDKSCFKVPWVPQVFFSLEATEFSGEAASGIQGSFKVFRLCIMKLI